MTPTDARLEARSAAVQALAAALPPDQARRAAQALREAVGALLSECSPGPPPLADAAMAADVGGVLGALVRVRLATR